MSIPMTPFKESMQATLAKTKTEPPSMRTPQKIVYVIVGNAREKFGVHKELICFHSPYFRAAFNGNFIEAVSGEVTLESAQPEVFGLFVEWLYVQDLAETRGTGECELPSTAHLVELWLLAEYLRVPKLQNRALDIIRGRRLRIRKLDLGFYETIYERTVKGSVLRKFFVDRLCWSTMKAEKILEGKEHIPSEMFLDLFAAERNRRQEILTKNPLRNMSNYLVDESASEQRALAKATPSGSKD